MKKFLLFIFITHLFLIINSKANSQDNLDNNQDFLKIGVLVPLSGEYQNIGNSILNAVKLAVLNIGDKKIKIYPKDSQASVEKTFSAAKEFQEMGINIILGPIFYKNLEKLGTLDNLIFLSLTNKSKNLPPNVIALGINVVSQFKAINTYLEKNKFRKTLLLIPDSDLKINLKEITDNKKNKFYDIFFYSTDPKKITSEIQKITRYKERKINLISRKKILQNSNLEEDKKELKYLEQKYTLGKLNFDSVIVSDFGENLKSVLTSFNFSDVTSEDVIFFTLNQWFDENLFDERSTENLFFPSINYDNFDEFRKEYFKKFGKVASEISILAYDGIGLINHTWKKNKTGFKIKKLNTKNGFNGAQGQFIIKKNISHQKLKVYKISNKNFFEVN